MPGLRRYRKLCNEVDSIMLKVGIPDVCGICYSIRPACCVGCDYLKDSKCRAVSLGCKLWLCFKTSNEQINGNLDLQKTMSRYPHHVKRLKEIYEIGTINHWIEPRKGIAEIKNNEPLVANVLTQGLEYLYA